MGFRTAFGNRNNLNFYYSNWCNRNACQKVKRISWFLSLQNIQILTGKVMAAYTETTVASWTRQKNGFTLLTSIEVQLVIEAIRTGRNILQDLLFVFVSVLGDIWNV